LVEEIGGPGENHRRVASHLQTLSHNVVHLALIEIRKSNRDCRGRDRMVVGFTTTYAISAYHH
jgi:hypothetical protein